MDYVVGLPRTLRKFDAVWVIVDRLTKLAHFIPLVTTYNSERLTQIYISEIVQLHSVPISIISDRGPQITLHFWRAVQISLESLSNKGIMRFGKKGKLSPTFIGLLEVLRRVGEVTYELSLPPSLSGVLPVFTCLCSGDISTIQLDESMGYKEEPIAIVDRQVRQLRSKRISAIKVQWRDQPVDEATWESEKDIRSRYPHLFSTPGMILDLFEDERLIKM
ncbi:uncharacterized protein [Nicotiana sylvestris]|uniref:uncharacterized protein n=1 Tax=Nicotiana sylvestris TaxID=4096 RepID=UPI00388C4D4C